jgi:peptidylprolyl isomerase
MDRTQVLKVMVPVAGFAVLLLIVGGVIALNSGGGARTAATPSGGPSTPPPDQRPPSGPPPGMPKMDFALDDPNWKDVGGGLKVWDVKEGTGDVCPTLAEKPDVWPIMHYTGWLTDGTPFDSSRPKGRPLNEYSLKQLVKGWQQGVPGMKVGGVRRLIIPPDLGYGSKNQPGIPANSTLVFEMELVSVQ